MATKPSPTEGIMHPDRPTTIAMPIVDFRPTSFPDKPIAMYTAHAIRLAPEPTDEEDVQDQKSPGEKEMKPVLKAVLDGFKRDFMPREGTVLDVDGRTIVSFQDMRLGGERKYRVTGAVYDGSGRPDGMGVWERICLGRDEEGRGRVRWICVEGVELEKGEVKIIGLEPELLALGEEYRRFQFSVGIHEKSFGGLRGLVEVSQAHVGPAADKARNCLHALLKHEFATGPRQKYVVRGNKLFSDLADAVVRGVEFRKGVAKSLHLANPGCATPIGDHHSGVTLREKECHQLFLPETSLASFVETHFSKAASSLNPTSTKLMSDALKGTEVRVLSPKHGWVKTICNFSDKTPDQQKISSSVHGVEIRVSDFYASDDIVLNHPHLPCVNLGSQKWPYYVPPELCSILPDQPFHHSGDKAFQREVAALRLRHLPHKLLIDANYDPYEPRVAKFKEGKDKTPIEQSLNDYGTQLLLSEGAFHYSKCRNYESSRMGETHIIFVEVGTSTVKSRSWSEFQDVVRSQAQQLRLPAKGAPLPLATVDDEVVRLLYAKDEACASEWCTQLSNVISASGKHASNVVVLFSIEEGPDRAEIFRTMKAVCNSDAIGVQSIGVHIASLHREMMNNKSAGLVRYVRRIYRKIFARTPAATGRSPHEELAVGIHVSPLSGCRGEKSSYLVAFASRQMKFAVQYRTSVHMFAPNDPTAPKLETLFFEHIEKHGYDKSTAPESIVVFRSGLPWPCWATESDSTESSPRSEMFAESESTIDGNSQVASTIAAHDILTECALLTRSLNKCSWANDSLQLYVIEVSTDKSLDILWHVEQDIARTMNRIQAEKRASTPRNPKGIFFLSGKGLLSVKSDELRTYNHTARRGSASFTKLKMHPRLKVDQWRDAPATTTTMNGTPNRGTQDRKPSKMSPGALNDRDSRHNTPTHPPKTYAISHNPQEQSLEAVTANLRKRAGDDTCFPHQEQEGRERLARIFCDNHIGLHESNVPIPTYLARRVIGWAMAHMEYVTEDTVAGGPVFRPVLPKVHKNRENDLWYL
ncbi:hypothetical protein KC331_g11167 [Hortaea werneckii]|nr:hypothetical protein KC331_g11167 [Hortaea werneckii]KAI7703698.1 hypothetical protein KC353_g13947 [Hortaea werneckii]